MTIARRFLAALALIALPFAALAQIDLSAADPGALFQAVLDAVQSGHVAFAVVIGLLLAVRVVRKFAGAKVAAGLKAAFKVDDSTAEDLEGHFVLFLVTGLVMVAGPLGSGAAFSWEMVKVALLTAASASGGWAFLSKFAQPVLDKLFGNVPVLGGLLAKLMGLLVGKTLDSAVKPPVPPDAPTDESTHTGP